MSKFKKRINLMPWYIGLQNDLLFYIAIDTLFFTIVKKLNLSQISLITTISIIVGICTQFISLKIIKKIGNTNSIRVGNFLFIMSALFLTFSKKLPLLIFGKILYVIAFPFKNIINVILHKNLKYLNKEEEFIQISTKGNIIYSILTCLIAVLIGPIFNINHYLPMYLCILVTIICFIISFYIYDIYEQKNMKEIAKKQTKLEKSIFSKLTLIIILIILFYGISYAIVDVGNGQEKLLIQEQLLLSLSTKKVANILGIIITISRISRIVLNYIFNKINKYFNNRVGIVLSIILTLSLLLIIYGYSISNFLLLKTIIMTIGFSLTLSVRDAFKVYSYDILLKNCNPKHQSEIITYSNLFSNIFSFVISLSATLILTKFKLIYVMFILLALSLLLTNISIKIYKKIKNN